VNEILPVGKLPARLLAEVLANAPINDPNIVLGPGPGLDCAVLDVGDDLLVLKSDPITFTTDQIGYYLIQVNANDIATTGAEPRWLLITLLLPENKTTSESVRQLTGEIFDACSKLNVSVIGGHTEVTTGLDKPIAVATMLGVVTRDRLVVPTGACPGDRILVTKGVPIEATAILAREYSDSLVGAFSESDVNKAQDYLMDPGISVVRDSKIALDAGAVTAMHDPTEGGIINALWELADACQHTLVVDSTRIPVLPLAALICGHFKIDPLSAISSGALLITSPPDESMKIAKSLTDAGINCSDIGYIQAGKSMVYDSADGRNLELPRPDQDEIARYFSSQS
jgi:hydrogenase expression/formation protein HypE